MSGAIYYRELARNIAKLAKNGNGKAADARGKLPAPISDDDYAKTVKVLQDAKFLAKHGLTKPSDV